MNLLLGLYKKQKSTFGVGIISCQNDRDLNGE